MMSGIDRQRFVSMTDEDYEDIKCGVCLGVLNKPLVTQCCQQSYCGFCINQWIRTSKTCPNCRKQVTAKKLSPVPRFSLNLIEKFDIFCEFKDNGCQNVCKLSVLDQHLSNCPFNPKNKCLYCNESMKGQDIKRHNCGQRLKELVDSLRHEIQELKTTNENLRSVSRKFQNKTTEEENRFAEDLRKKSEEFETLLTANTSLEQRLSDVTKESVDLKTKARDLSEQNHSFSVENGKLKNELKDLRNYCNDFLNKRESFDKTIDCLTKELNKTKEDFNEMSGNSEKQLIQMNGLIEENEELKRNLFSNEQHMSEVIKSARDHIQRPDILRSKLSKIRQNIAMNKMIESIERFDSFKEIAINLKKEIESYKRGLFWNVIVFSHTCCHSINYSNEDIFDVSFGKLRIKLISV